MIQTEEMRPSLSTTLRTLAATALTVLTSCGSEPSPTAVDPPPPAIVDVPRCDSDVTEVATVALQEPAARRSATWLLLMLTAAEIGPQAEGRLAELLRTLELGATEEALGSLEALVDLGSPGTQAWSRYLQHVLDGYDLAELEPEFHYQLHRLDPDSLYLLKMFVQSLWAGDRLVEAREALEDFLREHPDIEKEPQANLEKWLERTELLAELRSKGVLDD